MILINDGILLAGRPTLYCDIHEIWMASGPRHVSWKSANMVPTVQLYLLKSPLREIPSAPGAHSFMYIPLSGVRCIPKCS